MQTPIYLFTGFLEAGKTRFLQETLQDPKFNEGESMLLLLCEEGEEELDLSRFPAGGKNVTVATVDDEEMLTADRLMARIKRTKPQRVLIEYNGMWSLDTLYNSLPPSCFVCEEIFLADANTILTYNANMRQLVYDKLKSAQMVIFNRVKPGTDVMPLHQLVRAVTRQAAIGYEYEDGTFIPDEIEDPLPFDIEAPVIDIAEKDYAIWYAHLSENMDEYNGKTVSFLAELSHSDAMGDSLLAVGRRIMVCCADDIAYRPLVAKCKRASRFHTGDWAKVTGTIRMETSPFYQGKGPVLYVSEIQSAAPADPVVATFY